MPTLWEYQWKAYHLETSEGSSRTWYTGSDKTAVKMGDDLNAFGRQGWELVSLVVEDRDSSGSSTRLTAVLKRPLSE